MSDARARLDDDSPPSNVTDSDVSDSDVTDGTPTDNTIEVVLPARLEMAATLRLLVASLGADCGFTVDEIDDVRLAVSEVLTAAAETGEPRRISVTFRPDAHELTIIIFLLGPDTIQLDELGTTILRSVVDDYDDSDGTITMIKRAAEALA